MRYCYVCVSVLSMYLCAVCKLSTPHVFFVGIGLCFYRATRNLQEFSIKIISRLSIRRYTYVPIR